MPFACRWRRSGQKFATERRWALKPNRSELSRLLVAAVISRRFRQLLLNEPAKALEDGYNGETFSFTPAERQLIFGEAILAKPPSGKTKTLEEFALRLTQLTGQIDAEPDKS